MVDIKNLDPNECIDCPQRECPPHPHDYTQHCKAIKHKIPITCIRFGADATCTIKQ